MLLLSIDWTNLHELLRSLYDEMMPLCEDMASVAKGVAGLGALFYVAYRVWQSLARADRRVPPVPALRAGPLHHVFSHYGTGYNQRDSFSRMQSDFLTGRTADLRHEEIPGRERQAETRGDAA